MGVAGHRRNGLIRFHAALPRSGSITASTAAAAVIALAAFAKIPLDAWAGESLPPYITLYPAVVIASLIGGPSVGFAVAGLSLLIAWYFWVPSYGSFAVADTPAGLTLGIYTVTASLLAAVVGMARISLDRIVASEAERAHAARESVHRIRNLIAVVQAISSKVACEVETSKDFRDVLGERLNALNVAQDVLVRRDWSDAPLGEIIRNSLAPFMPNPGLHVEEGPPVTVPARYVSGLCMALYELCTNAMKYGALAGGKGPARLSWRIADNCCVLDWQEQLAERAEPGERSGLGTTIINLALSRDRGTEVHYAIGQSAVTARFRWPLKRPMPTP